MSALREASLAKLHERFLEGSAKYSELRFAAMTCDDELTYKSILGTQYGRMPSFVFVLRGPDRQIEGEFDEFEELEKRMPEFQEAQRLAKAIAEFDHIELDDNDEDDDEDEAALRQLRIRVACYLDEYEIRQALEATRPGLWGAKTKSELLAMILDRAMGLAHQSPHHRRMSFP